MFAPLMDAVRADIDRQVGWARDEIRRQIRYAAFIGVIAGMGTLAALGMIGAGLLLLMLILLLVAFSLRRPGVNKRPALQVVRAATLFRTGTNLNAKQAVAAGEDSLRLATDTLREGTRSELLGALALIAIVGVIAGRSLRRRE